MVNETSDFSSDCAKDEVSSNNDIVFVDEIDSDDGEIIVHDGYEPLPVNDFVEFNNSEDDEEQTETDSDSAGTITNNESLPSIIPIENTLVQELWSRSNPPEAVDIEMDGDKVDEVKKVMEKITLPPSSIPEWANNVPETEWKEILIKRIQNTTSK